MFVPLGIGVILPSFHEVGNVPVDTERLNNLHSDGAMLRDMDFNIFGEIPLLPADLDIPSPTKSSRTLTPLYKETEQGSDLDRGNHMGS